MSKAKTKSGDSTRASNDKVPVTFNIRLEDYDALVSLSRKLEISTDKLIEIAVSEYLETERVMARLDRIEAFLVMRDRAKKESTKGECP